MLVFFIEVIGSLLDLMPQSTGIQAVFSATGGAILLFQALAASRIIRRTAEANGMRVSSVPAALLTPISPLYFQWKLNQLVARIEASADATARPPSSQAP